MGKNGVNQKEIAKTLNLSVATVSKALSDYSDINSSTRAKVINMATKLGYQATNRSRRRSSAETESKFVGVFIHNPTDRPHHSTYFAGMSEKCAKLNVSLVLQYFDTDGCHKIFQPEFQPPAMRDGQLSGLILVNRWPAEVVQKLVEQYPCVSILHPAGQLPIDVVDIDENRAIAALMDHLYTLGHRKIGFFGRCGAMAWSRSRFGAYTESLCRLGLEYDNDAICDVPLTCLEDKIDTNPWEEMIEYAAEQTRKGVRAWMCPSDWAGYVLTRGMLDRSFDVPRDVSITGFDNVETNTLGCPELTSISTPVLKMGAEALRRVMSRLRHPSSPPLNVKLRCKFIEGRTAAAPPVE